YCPVADGIWLEIHQLYRLDRPRMLHQTSINDCESGNWRFISIDQTYVAIQLLSSARRNQMLQSIITRLYNALESWSSMASLVEPESPSALFIINPDMDCPPRYRSLVQAEDLTGSLGLDTSRLVEAIKNHMLDGEQSDPRLVISEGMGLELLQHVSESWGDL